MIELPVLPLRDVVVFPHMVIPLFVGRQKSIKALDSALEGDKKILLLTQKNSSSDDPTLEDLYEVGTLANILQLLRLPDGTIKVLAEGVARMRVKDAVLEKPFLAANALFVEDEHGDRATIEALTRILINEFEIYARENKKVPPEAASTIAAIEDPLRLADTIAGHLPIRIPEKQKLLEITSLTERLETLAVVLTNELDILDVEKKIRSRVKEQMEKNQREYYLNEQVKAIQKELGEEDSDFDDLEEKLKTAKMPPAVFEKAQNELRKLKMMQPMSAEFTVSRTYLETLLSVPWSKRTKVRRDLAYAQQVLDEDHYGLKEVKDRIIEHLAVQNRIKSAKGPILCLVGPPGVGKTSLGRSIARATNRKFARISLGGVRDEAEIRGHRRTYIGALPGKIIQHLIKAGTKNPLFILDEVDKIGMDYRGDPAAALLEVLDPEQNRTFADHYLEVDCDLSEVMFICTANTLNIPAPLLDRMEVIRIPGYTEEEKEAIARTYLLPKQMKEAGLREKELALTDRAISAIARDYTREAGVRSLERELAKICRKVVKKLTTATDEKNVKLDSADLYQYLGVPPYSRDTLHKENAVGRVTGLAWTEVGGEILTIECVRMPGKGKMTTTGKLGDVMQESIHAAFSVVRSRASRLGIAKDFHDQWDVHVHLPEGAVPKDGPSAGAAVCTALVSVFTDIPVRADVAMTGEITLRGEVLAIGGLKEKLLAAKRAGVQLVLIPEANVKDLADIPDDVKNALEIRPVRWIDEVLELALEKMPDAQAGEASELALVNKSEPRSPLRKH
jgi:ATP-dependent Lon protease